MDLAAIYHRPESEYAYLVDSDTMHIRIRTKIGDCQQVRLLAMDPYLMDREETHQYLRMQKIAQTKLHDYWQVAVKLPHRRIQYLFLLEGRDGERAIFGEMGPVDHHLEALQSISNYFKLPYFHQVDRIQTPDWVGETIWYQIFPDRFARGRQDLAPDNIQAWDPHRQPHYRDFYGGDLQGVIDHLDYLQDLGITGLYFCPIFEASSNHKYDTVNYLQIDPHFGDKALFKDLVDQAHARGMKVMLDAVFNHMGTHAPQWQDVLDKGPDSVYYDWFHIRQWPLPEDNQWQWQEGQDLPYDMFAFATRMPKLNTANPQVRDYLLNIATYWIREFDIDGWRLDVANEVDHQFWRDFHQAVLSQKPDLYILGEIWHSSQSWLGGDQLHAVMNYQLASAVNGYFLDHSLTEADLFHKLETNRMLYAKPINQVMFNLLDSHDTQRMLRTAGGKVDRVQQALAFLMLQEGSPCIYYGTEVGMDGGPDPDNRRAMAWDPADQDLDMLAYTKQVLALRHRIAPLIQEGQVAYSCVQEGLVEQSIRGTKASIRAFYNRSHAPLSVVIGQQEDILFAHKTHQQAVPCLEPGGVLVVIKQKEENPWQSTHQSV